MNLCMSSSSSLKQGLQNRTQLAASTPSVLCLCTRGKCYQLIQTSVSPLPPQITLRIIKKFFLTEPQNLTLCPELQEATPSR